MVLRVKWHTLVSSPSIFTLLLILTCTRYRRHFQAREVGIIGRNTTSPLTQKELRRLPRDLAVSLPITRRVNRPWMLTFLVDPEQAQENIAYGRALNSEVGLYLYFVLGWILIIVVRSIN